MASKTLNKVILIGHLGRDPELTYTPTGLAVAKFSLATNERRKDESGNITERTEWHNIIVWRKLAEVCGQYLKKGSKVYIEGRIQTRSWDDKNTGIKRYLTEIVADDLIMLDAKAIEGDQTDRETVDTDILPEEEKDDLPF